jgi:murein DD-endopeptidase MepM/ murein hydrolase activator NlpD
VKHFFFACLAYILLAACSSSNSTPSIATIPTAALTNTAQPSATATLTPSQTPIPETQICSPLRDHALVDLRKYISQPFIAPLGENKEMGHHGVDFAYYHRDGVGGPLEGNPILSALDGNMAGLGYNAVYGNYLIIETPFERLPVGLATLLPIQPGESLYLLYAHMLDLAPFEIREPLDCGQQIGQVGESGRQPDMIAEPHLHFETRVGASGVFIEPMAFYDTQVTEAEKQEYIKWRSSGEFVPFDPMLLLDFGASLEEVNG